MAQIHILFDMKPVYRIECNYCLYIQNINSLLSGPERTRYITGKSIRTLRVLCTPLHIQFSTSFFCSALCQTLHKPMLTFFRVNFINMKFGNKLKVWSDEMFDYDEWRFLFFRIKNSNKINCFSIWVSKYIPAKGDFSFIWHRHLLSKLEM